MSNIKGFRFHPTDEEAIQLLWDKVFDRDSSVQFITQLKDICEFDPWELPGRSKLETVDNYWYFFSTPKFKYRNSVRKNRVSKNGYWNPTGKPRQIVTIYHGERIKGSKQTLVFYKGRVNDKQKKENKTHWVMHEIELKPQNQDLKPPNQRSITLCRLKIKYKKVVTSRDEEISQSSHSMYSSLEGPGANNAIPKDPLNSKDLIVESQAINECSEIQTLTTNEQDDDEFVNSLLTNDYLPENQEDFNGSFYMALNQATTLAMTPQNHVAEDVIPMNQEDFNGSIDMALNQATTLAMTPQNHLVKDVFPMEHLESNYALHDGLSLAELSPVWEAPKIPDGLNIMRLAPMNRMMSIGSIFLTLDEVEDYPEIFLKQ